MNFWKYEGKFKELKNYCSNDLFLYGIEWDNGITKIGISTSPIGRIQYLSRFDKKTNIKKIIISYPHFMNFREEWYLKKYFKKYQVFGEYFKISIKDIKEAIKEKNKEK